MSKAFWRAARLLLPCVLAIAPPAVADDAQPAVPKRTQLDGGPAASVLWVGNSFFLFNNGIQRQLRGLARGSGPGAPHIRSTLIAITDSGLDWHDVDSYLRPGSRVGWYSPARNNTIVFNRPGRQYDTVVMMDCSQCPIHPRLKDVFREYAKKDADIARKYGVRPVFFMSWAYKDRPEMTRELAQAYTSAGNDDDALVIPAGLAFAAARAKRPELELYQPDKRHPTLPGTYLAACTSYAALTGRSPVGNTYRGGLPADTARFLQTVAWETVRSYYGAH